jgi:hypothetical protein
MNYANKLPLGIYLQEKEHLTKFAREQKKTFTITGTLTDWGSPNKMPYVTITDGKAKETFRIRDSDKILEKYDNMYAFLSHVEMRKDKEVQVEFNTKDNTLLDLI